MSKPIPSYLRLHVEEGESEPAPARAEHAEAVAAVQQAFQRATGWPLELGELDGANPLPTLADDDAIRELGSAIAQLAGELQATRRALWRREAELAAGVPLVSHPDEDGHLAARLQAVLRGAAEAVDANAAALYLLDEATSHLKLRASWGLGPERFLQAPRPLRGAVADLEALTGHAVAIEDVRLLPHWRVPEGFASAACVPVSSPSTPLGTLWVFAEQVRDYSQRQTNLLEIVAGRIAADLEREVLLADAAQSRALREDWQRVQEEHQSRFLALRSLDADAWELAALGGAQEQRAACVFCDWQQRRDGAIAFALGIADGQRLAAVLAAEMLHGAVKASLLDECPPAQLVQRANEVLWSTSAGDRFARLAAGVLAPGEGRLEVCLAGELSLFHVREGEGVARPVASVPHWPRLGSDPDARYRSVACTLAPGDGMAISAGDDRSAEGAAADALARAMAAAGGKKLESIAAELPQPQHAALLLRRPKSRRP